MGALRVYVSGDHSDDPGAQKVHVIGDRANGVVLDAFEGALAEANGRSLRPHLEHARIIAKKDKGRFGEPRRSVSSPLLPVQSPTNAADT